MCSTRLELWSPNIVRNKEFNNEMQSVQRAMEGKIIGIRVKNKISIRKIRLLTQSKDREYTIKKYNSSMLDMWREWRNTDGIREQ